MTTWALGIDIGGTNLRAALVDTDSGTAGPSARRRLKERSPESVAKEVGALVREVGSSGGVGAIGVGVAGMLRRGVVVNAPNLGWRDVDFGRMLTTSLGSPVRVVNDLSAAAWGEFRCGAARGARHSFTCFVGTGVGSAIISEGVLLEGAWGAAAEFGHIKIVAEGGRRCGCGDDGCLEAYMGGAGLTAWMREEGLEGTPADLEASAQAGNTSAKRLYDFAVGSLALAIANQVTVLNPEVVVLGGGVLGHNPGMVQRICDVVKRRAGPAARSAVQIKLAHLGDDSGIIGAALLASNGRS